LVRISLVLKAVAFFDANASDGFLIAAALQGQDEAFAQLVKRYQGPLMKAAMSRLGRRELAEEAVQETFLCAHRWLATYDSRYSFRTWLWTIVLNQCSRQAKREAKHQVRVAASVRSAALSRGNWEGRCLEALPLDQLLSRERAEHLRGLLGRLPEPQADALRLRFFGELTFPEIAAVMQCSEPGAKQRVKVGLMKLAKWLNEGAARRDSEQNDI
jgi:RNA polymerase sigma-70 factor (ECF subfamily)